MRNVTTLVLAGAMLAGLSAAAQAACQGRLTNRSGYLVTLSQDGGPEAPPPSGRSLPIRYVRPGRLDVAALCPGIGPGVGPGAAPVQSASLTYQAVLDRCYIEVGDGFFERQIGPAFIDGLDVKPFTVNAPRQGDIAVAGAPAGCPLPPRISARY